METELEPQLPHESVLKEVELPVALVNRDDHLEQLALEPGVFVQEGADRGLHGERVGSKLLHVLADLRREGLRGILGIPDPPQEGLDPIDFFDLHVAVRVSSSH